jgi:hypothetical protein
LLVTLEIHVWQSGLFPVPRLLARQHPLIEDNCVQHDQYSIGEMNSILWTGRVTLSDRKSHNHSLHRTGPRVTPVAEATRAPRAPAAELYRYLEILVIAWH